MLKVLISDKMSPLAEEIFKARGVEVDYKPGLSPDELKACIGDYAGLAIRSNTKVTADIIAAAVNLKVIGRAGIGVDNVDVPAATAKGVVVMNTPFGNSVTTAEHALAMMMALARDIPQASASTHAGKWEKSKFMGVELFGKTLGVIGCGNIGGYVAERAIGLKMRVVAYDPFLSPERARALGCEKVELNELFARADFITLHTPLTDATRGIISEKSFGKMKKGVRIINCARGGLVDEASLKVALDDGRVAGAALDVFESEPAKENVLFGHPKVICTPHLGASTKEAQVNVAVQVAEQISDFLLTGSVTNALNMPSVSAEDAPKLKPYMKLVEYLGSFAGQITRTGIKAVNVAYEGTVADLNTKPLTAIALAGLLQPMLDSVNMVSAPAVAKERNIALSETKHETCAEYQTLVKLTVTTETQTRSVSGTLFAGKPRLVEVNGIPVEAEFGAHMVFFTNKDKPGLIGKLGSALGMAGVNIATFHLGRNAVGEDAVALVQIDGPLKPDVLEELRRVPNVVRVEALKF
ncbi:D-3-phosphoglycerate dehydrogenase [uncultured Alphaproteobacteria bacterium]|uniref:D-3-phosphoglycerate dehydrogenase n=1 Tax=uncultured Alphaproteobacteria bacterium TaxID=91750 RepID=A0A212JQM2_9PROT|nr:D-3-phosphoglycerate dehydrogenase [uncultured Alphaproteobacteria bacterium]